MLWSGNSKVILYREVKSELWSVNADSGICIGEVKRMSWSGNVR